MPPRYVYWTIIVDGQPTAFRSGSLEDIMPTFNRLKEKQPSAELKWFQNGQLWPSRHDAQDFMRARGELGRAKDPRQSGATPGRAWNAKPEWKTRSSFSPSSDKPRVNRDEPAGERPAWVPKGDKREGKPAFAKAPARQAQSPAGQARSDRKPEWKPKGTFKPKEEGHRPSARDRARSSFRPKSFTPKVDDGRTRSSRVQSRNDKLEWTPKDSSPKPQAPSPEGKRKWVPKAEYKKSLGIEAKRDDKWRPGGEHKDPKQKYKDAKKAKWTKFKANIRARSTGPRKPKGE